MSKRNEAIITFVGLLAIFALTLIGAQALRTEPDPKVVTLTMSYHHYFNDAGEERGDTEYSVLVVDDGVRVDVDMGLVLMAAGNGDQWCEAHGGEKVVGVICQGVSLSLLEP